MTATGANGRVDRSITAYGFLAAATRTGAARRSGWQLTWLAERTWTEDRSDFGLQRGRIANAAGIFVGIDRGLHSCSREAPEARDVPEVDRWFSCCCEEEPGSRIELSVTCSKDATHGREACLSLAFRQRIDRAVDPQLRMTSPAEETSTILGRRVTWIGDFMLVCVMCG